MPKGFVSDTIKETKATSLSLTRCVPRTACHPNPSIEHLSSSTPIMQQSTRLDDQIGFAKKSLVQLGSIPWYVEDDTKCP